MGKLVALLLAALLVAGCGDSGGADRDLPRLTGRVVDIADLISARGELTLAHRLAALERRTSDQFVIVTLPTLRGEPIEELGLRLGNRWGVGQRDKDNGILLIVAPEEKKVRIEVGIGLESVLTDPECARIIRDDILPYFRQGHMERGIIAGADAVIATLNRNSISAPARKAA